MIPPAKKRATRVARKATVHGMATLFDLQPALVVNGETHRRVIVASAFNETHVFPTFGKPRVLGTAALPFADLALKSIGYEVAR